jgi:hypothetical protein
MAKPAYLITIHTENPSKKFAKKVRAALEKRLGIRVVVLSVKPDTAVTVSQVG